MQSDATRILGVMKDVIEQNTKSAAGVEITYGQVASVSGREALVYLAGARELAISDGGTPEASEEYRIPSHMYVAANDFVRVSIDSRGHRWIDEVISSTTHPKLAIDIERGIIKMGDGTADPITVLTRTGTFAYDIAGNLSVDLLYASQGIESISAIRSFRAISQALSSDALVSETTGFGDTSERFGIQADGDMRWGPGSAAIDTTLQRVGAGILQIQATGVLDATLRIGDDAQFYDVDIADRIGIKSATTPANGGIVFGSDKDTNLYREGANILRTDDLFAAYGGLYIPSGVSYMIGANPLLRYVPLTDTAINWDFNAIVPATTADVEREFSVLPANDANIIAVAVGGIIRDQAAAAGAAGGANTTIVMKNRNDSTVAGAAYSGGVGQRGGSFHFPYIRVGGTNNRSIYIGSSAANNTATYWLKVYGYWTKS